MIDEQNVLSDAPKGEVTVDGDRMRVVFRRRYAKPVAKVWAALTVPERIADAFLPGVMGLGSPDIELLPEIGQSLGVAWFAENGPLFAVQVSLLKDVATLTLDTTGPGLHKRGYRTLSGPAPQSRGRDAKIGDAELAQTRHRRHGATDVHATGAVGLVPFGPQ